MKLCEPVDRSVGSAGIKRIFCELKYNLTAPLYMLSGLGLNINCFLVGLNRNTASHAAYIFSASDTFLFCLISRYGQYNDVIRLVNWH